VAEAAGLAAALAAGGASLQLVELGGVRMAGEPLSREEDEGGGAQGAQGAAAEEEEEEARRRRRGWTAGGREHFMLDRMAAGSGAAYPPLDAFAFGLLAHAVLAHPLDLEPRVEHLGACGAFVARPALPLRAAPVRGNMPAGFWADPAPGAGGGEVADAALCLHCPAVRRCRGLLRLLLREAASERLTLAAALESEWLRHV
jgi:hypothetical protein